MSQHDLFDFFKNANEEIEKEYKRICRRVREDPGTAGDQGEENWRKFSSCAPHRDSIVMPHLDTALAQLLSMV